MSTPSYFPFHSSRRFYIYTISARESIEKGEIAPPTKHHYFRFPRDRFVRVTKKKNIALKGIETIIEGCVHVKEEERGRVLWGEQIMKRGANWEATIEPLKNDGRWLSSGAFVAAAKFQLRCRPRLAENLRVTMTRDAFEACHRLTLRVVTREQGSYCHVFLIVFNLPYMYVTILG